MENITKKLTDWAINKIKAEYPDDVALLIAVEGHSVNNDGHGLCFDYFVPATERGNELSQTFIINGIGYDLYPRDWERLERTTSLDDFATLCLANAIILYSRSKEDETKFLNIRHKLLDNLSDNVFVHKKALVNLDIAMDVYRTMTFEKSSYKIKVAAGYIVFYLVNAVTYLNNTYEKDWSNGKLPHLKQLKNLPVNFIECYQSILNCQNDEDLKTLAHLIISTTRSFIAKNKPEKSTGINNEVNFENLADWYQEISLWWRRLRFYCEIGNIDAAFMEASNIQGELNVISEEFGLGEIDLIGAYDADNLALLSIRASETENYVISQIEKNNVKISSYKSFEEFISLNK